MGSGSSNYCLRALLLPAIVAVFFSCRKDPSLYRFNNLNNGTVLVFGHGGMGRAYRLPMNSAAALKECLATGADGVEMDVRRCADGTLFLFHDQDMSHSTDCRGRVEEKNAGELSGCGYKKGRRSHGVISLRHFLETIPLNSWFVFDCKTPGSRAEYILLADSLAALLQTFGIAERSIVESPDPAVLQRMADVAPQAQRYLYTDDVAAATGLAGQVPLDGITIDKDRVSVADIARAHDAGLKVTLFNVSSANDNFDALSLQPDNIQTDRVEHLVRSYVNKRAER